ncbi:MAG: DUF421 domain-containing protein [Clostridia bacterium]|nr:DUF421 domain-containing protein [Clostridia bacterium]
MIMLVVIIRTLVILLFLLLGLRLMGKRQLGQLQPFEFVITLVVAELATTPLEDISTPLLYGIVPLLTVFVTHYFLTLLSTKSIWFRKVMNGKPLIVINENGIDADNLKKLNMDVNDLMEGLRAQQFFSVEQIAYAIIETNGNLSLLQREQAETPKSVPFSIVVEGKIINANLGISNTSAEQIYTFLREQNINLKNVILMTTESNRIFVQPKNEKYFTVDLS